MLIVVLLAAPALADAPIAWQEEFESSKIEETVKAWIAEKDFSFGKVMPPLRLVIVGDMKGPHLFDIMALIGKTESIGRIKAAIGRL